LAWPLAYSSFGSARTFLESNFGNKKRMTNYYFLPDFSGELRVLTTSSYAYEIYYVLNGSGSQSNVV